MDPISSVVSGAIAPICNLIDSLFTSDEEREKAKLALITQQGQQKLAETAQQMSAIMAEAQSADPWTSRARPSFMYVVYALIIWSLPMSVLWAIKPDTAKAMIEGFHAWLSAIPDAMWQTFTVGYLGYTVSRSAEKSGGIMPLITGKK